MGGGVNLEGEAGGVNLEGGAGSVNLEGGAGPICCGQCVKVGIVSALKSPQKGEGAQPTCPFPAKSLQWTLAEFAAKSPHDNL